MRKKLILGTAILGLLFSCSKESKDKSLSIQEYYDLGLPSINSTWAIDEYRKCLEVLKKERANNFHSLPQLKNENSKEIFKRIISSENIDQLFTEQRQDKLNLKDFHTLFQELIILYVNEDETEVDYHEELMEFFIFLIRTLDATFLNLKSLPKVDLSSHESEQLHKRIINGYKKQIIAFLGMQLSGDMNFTKNDINKLSLSITESLTKNHNSLDNETRKEISDKLKEVIELTTSNSVKGNYSKVLQKYSSFSLHELNKK